MKIKRSKRKVFQKKFVFLSVIILSCFLTIYAYNKQEQNRKLFESLSVILKDRPTIEYGTDNKSALAFIKGSSGTVQITKGNLDSMNVGTQEVVLQVQKNGIQRTFSFKVEVKDTRAPSIELKEDTISLAFGESFDFCSNIENVYDLVDGDLSYIPLGDVVEGQNNYYTYETNFNGAVAGDYTVNVRAVDKHNNIAEKAYTVHVEAPKVEEVTPSYPSMDASIINVNTVADGSKQGIVNTAYTLLGLPYVYGGNSISGFDCSGFVHYVHGVNGISVPRSTRDQLYMGMSVSLEEAMPGDILVWSNNSSGTPTHTAIYVGGGNMIHAANPRKGVIVNGVSEYASYGNRIISVRRM